MKNWQMAVVWVAIMSPSWADDGATSEETKSGNDLVVDNVTEFDVQVVDADGDGKSDGVYDDILQFTFRKDGTIDQWNAANAGWHDAFVGNFHSKLHNVKYCGQCHTLGANGRWGGGGDGDNRQFRIRVVGDRLNANVVDVTNLRVPLRTRFDRVYGELTGVAEQPARVWLFDASRQREGTVELVLAGDGTTDAEVNSAQVPHEQPKHWIGVSTEELSDLVRTQLKLDEGVGLAVIRVVDESPAKEAGIELHDVIVQVNETPMTEFAELSNAVKEAGEAGESMTIEYVRKGKRRKVEITPAERPQPENNVVDLEVANELDLRTLKLALADTSRHGQPFARWVAVGPAVVVDSSRSLPKGVTIRVEKTGGDEARIHVERDGQFWDVTEKTLGELPENLRGPVQSFLPKRSPKDAQLWTTQAPIGLRFEAAQLRQLELEKARQKATVANAELVERLERIERQLQELRESVKGNEAEGEE